MTTTTTTENYCVAEIHPGSYYDQPSYCEDESQEGSEYCERHQWMMEEAE